MRDLFLAVYQILYERALRRLIFRSSAQDAHHRMLRLLAWFDRSPLLCGLFVRLRRLTVKPHYVRTGGVTLLSPLILAAGLVKGEGFATEADALTAVASGRNIMPGWRSMPALAGSVEFGSFTRHPRLGNPGEVVWRDEASHSTQNRIGLKNPGARAASAFLAQHRHDLPVQFGINVAASPGVTDPEQETSEILEAFSAFIEQDVRPAWFTLNLSCPNTDDDPTGRQTEDQTRRLCGAVINLFQEKRVNTPLWVKISPELSSEQYGILMRVFHEVGVRAVIATNTLPHPTPTDATLTAGLGGRRLHPFALDAVRCLAQEKARHGYAVDVIGCGGALDGDTAQAFLSSGAAAIQYWTALIYRGPLAAVVIERELEHGRTAYAGGPRPAGS